MRSIARQSARLASNSNSRRPTAAKCRCCRQQRTFHASVQRAEPRSPDGQPHHTSLDGERHEAHKKSEHTTTNHDRVAEQDEKTTETPTSNENRKHGFKRSFRQKRVNDVPKPPPIPDWFLQNNVRLFKDSSGVNVSEESRRSGELIRCVDTETGHTLFTVPYYEAWPVSVSSEKGKSQGGVDSEKRKQPSMAPNDTTSTESKRPQRNRGKKSFEQDFFDHKYQTSKTSAIDESQVKNDATRKEDDSAVKASRFASLVKDLEATGANEDPFKSNSNPMRWFFLETETSVRAALSLANEDQRSSSFASDRIDLSLQCPDPNSHDLVDEFVGDVARTVGADLIRLDANDFAELAEDYVGQGLDGPGSFSSLGYDVFDGFVATSSRASQSKQMDIEEENDLDEDDEVDEDEQDGARGTSLGPFASMADIRRALQGGQSNLRDAIKARIVSIGIPMSPQVAQKLGGVQSDVRTSSTGQNVDMTRDDARLAALLDHLIDAAKQKRAATSANNDAQNNERRSPFKKLFPRFPKASRDDRNLSYQRILRFWRANPAFWLPSTAKSLVGYLSKALQDIEPGHSPFTLTTEHRSASDNTGNNGKPRTIIHLRDLRDLCNTALGESIVHRLVTIVRKRRRSGEQILIIGTTAQDVPGPFRIAGEQADAFPFRPISVPPFFNFSLTDDYDFELNAPSGPQKSLNEPAYRRILEINLRHLERMLQRLKPEDHVNLLTLSARGQLNMPGMHFLTEKVLSLDQVQRLVLIAIGLSQSHATADVVKPIHIALAGFIATKSEHAETRWMDFRDKQQAKKSKADANAESTKGASTEQTTESRVERLKKNCNQHETRLLSGMVDPQNIKTQFADVHAPDETIEALKTLTTLSLLRPDAFKYGVLANDRLPGLLLYGPPGTGKTLLAKAVAKESKATVLEISGAQIYEKYVGEGEKMVRAVFSLAKKLTPCVVFIDEADAIFGSRSNAGNRNTHREIINQFLREWDGMDDHGVFIMVASNRPFDLDDAVLRRLPRRLLVDLPVQKDRESILRIHLKGEELHTDVSISKLAEQTPLYSGSDLKNLAVAAALACVREENEIAAALRKEYDDVKFLPKRVLVWRHFEKALAEISASISEDMSSLTAIRKFDEQYGDRRGRRKKTGYGFGAADGIIDEGAARVRQPSTTSSPPSP